MVLKAFPLAKEVRLFLEENQKNLLSISRKEMSELEVAKLKSKLMDKFKEANFPQPAKTVDSIIALGKLILIGYCLRPIKLKPYISKGRVGHFKNSRNHKSLFDLDFLGPNGCGSNILINDIESYQVGTRL